jgi:cytochrome b pre-mRNA-processing protein 3
VSILSRLFGKDQDDRAFVRPLWHRVVELARDREWYASCGIADSVPGRFDMIALVLSVVLLRMEREPALIEPSVRLSELFVEDMEGQLRQRGIGDMVVGKHVGKLMGALGGRLGAIREALKQESGPLAETALAEVVARNATMRPEGGDPAQIAARLRRFADKLDALPGDDVLAGRIAL